MHFTEAELTVALTAVAKAALRAQSREIRKGRVDVEDVWRDLGGYGRYQLLDSLGTQILPVLGALPDVPRVHGERPSYTNGQVRSVVEARVDGVEGRLRRAAVVAARTALVQDALSQLPPWVDPEVTRAEQG